MKVAEIQITTGRHSFNNASMGVVGFDDAEKAKTEFDRLADLIKRYSERANDLDKIVVITGITEFACPIDQIMSIGLADFAKLNEQEAGVKDTFPNIFKR